MSPTQGMASSLLLQSISLSFRWQLSPDLLASSYLKNNKAYNFKQLGNVFHHLSGESGLVHLAASLQEQPESKPQCTSAFQVFASVVLALAPLAKARHTVMPRVTWEEWIQSRVWLQGAVA